MNAEQIIRDLQQNKIETQSNQQSKFSDSELAVFLKEHRAQIGKQPRKEQQLTFTLPHTFGNTHVKEFYITREQLPRFVEIISQDFEFLQVPTLCQTHHGAVHRLALDCEAWLPGEKTEEEVVAFMEALAFTARSVLRDVLMEIFAPEEKKRRRKKRIEDEDEKEEKAEEVNNHGERMDQYLKGFLACSPLRYDRKKTQQHPLEVSCVRVSMHMYFPALSASSDTQRALAREMSRRLLFLLPTRGFAYEPVFYYNPKGVFDEQIYKEDSIALRSTLNPNMKKCICTQQPCPVCHGSLVQAKSSTETFDLDQTSSSEKSVFFPYYRTIFTLGARDNDLENVVVSRRIDLAVSLLNPDLSLLRELLQEDESTLWNNIPEEPLSISFENCKKVFGKSVECATEWNKTLSVPLWPSLFLPSKESSRLTTLSRKRIFKAADFERVGQTTVENNDVFNDETLHKDDKFQTMLQTFIASLDPRWKDIVLTRVEWIKDTSLSSNQVEFSRKRPDPLAVNLQIASKKQKVKISTLSLQCKNTTNGHTSNHIYFLVSEDGVMTQCCYSKRSVDTVLKPTCAGLEVRLEKEVPVSLMKVFFPHKYFGTDSSLFMSKEHRDERQDKSISFQSRVLQEQQQWESYKQKELELSKSTRKRKSVDDEPEVPVRKETEILESYAGLFYETLQQQQPAAVEEEEEETGGKETIRSVQKLRRSLVNDLDMEDYETVDSLSKLDSMARGLKPFVEAFTNTSARSVHRKKQRFQQMQKRLPTESKHEEPAIRLQTTKSVSELLGNAESNDANYRLDVGNLFFWNLTLMSSEGAAKSEISRLNEKVCNDLMPKRKKQKVVARGKMFQHQPPATESFVSQEVQDFAFQCD